MLFADKTVSLSVGRAIMQGRNAKGMSQKDLATVLGIAARFITDAHTILRK